MIRDDPSTSSFFLLSLRFYYNILLIKSVIE